MSFNVQAEKNDSDEKNSALVLGHWVCSNVSISSESSMWLDAFQPLRQSVLLGDQAIWSLPGSWDASGDFQGSSPRSVNSQGLKVPAAVLQSEGLHGKMWVSETDAFKKHWSSKPFALGETFAAKNMLKKELHLVTVPDTFMAGKDGHLVRMNLTKRWK